MKIKFILGALAAVLLTTNVHAKKDPNPHKTGCYYNAKTHSIAEAKKQLAMIETAKKEFEEKSKIKQSVHCSKVAKQYEHYINTHTK